MLPDASTIDSLYGIHLEKPLSAGDEVRGFGTITSEIVAVFTQRTKAVAERRREDARARRGQRAETWRDPWDTIRP